MAFIPFWRYVGFGSRGEYLSFVRQQAAADRMELLFRELEYNISHQLEDLNKLLIQKLTEIGYYSATKGKPSERRGLVSNKVMKDLDKGIGKSLNFRLNELGRLVITRAKGLTPVRTGRLRNSYSYAINGTQILFANDAPYFRFVENDYHMLQRAYDEYEPQIIKAILDDAKILGRTKR